MTSATDDGEEGSVELGRENGAVAYYDAECFGEDQEEEDEA